MKDSELLAEVKARTELKKMGFTLKRCPTCKGTGVLNVHGSYFCSHCDRRGLLWVTPDGEECKNEFRD